MPARVLDLRQDLARTEENICGFSSRYSLSSIVFYLVLLMNGKFAIKLSLSLSLSTSKLGSLAGLAAFLLFLLHLLHALPPRLPRAHLHI
jgi:hypothetical protein